MSLERGYENNRIVPDIFRAIFNNNEIYLRNPNQLDRGNMC